MPSAQELLADLTGPDEAAAEAAVIELAGRGEAVTPALVEMLGSRDPDHRWWALRTLAGMGQPRTEWFLDAMRDESVEVRAAASLALASHPDPAAAPALVHALDDDDNVVAVLAVNALTKIGVGSVPLLLEAFPHSPQKARIQILRTLAEIRDPRAIRLMMDAMSEGSAALHYWAQEGLERLGLNMVYMKPD